MADTDWLVTHDRRRVTPNRYHAGDTTRNVQAYKAHLIEPVEGIIFHYTASGDTKRTVDWLCSPASQASAHFVLGRDGELWQLASLAERTWHAGGATSQFLGKRNVNGRTIGIEIVNWGSLTWDPDKTAWLNWIEQEAKNKQKSYKSYSGVVHADPLRPNQRAWEPYPDEQIVRLCELVESLLILYPLIAAEPNTRMVGHEDVDAMRKTDPGPAFPWSLIRACAATTPTRAHHESGCADGE